MEVSVSVRGRCAPDGEVKEWRLVSYKRRWVLKCGSREGIDNRVRRVWLAGNSHRRSGDGDDVIDRLYDDLVVSGL